MSEDTLGEDANGGGADDALAKKGDKAAASALADAGADLRKVAGIPEFLRGCYELVRCSSGGQFKDTYGCRSSG